LMLGVLWPFLGAPRANALGGCWRIRLLGIAFVVKLADVLANFCFLAIII